MSSSLDFLNFRGFCDEHLSTSACETQSLGRGTSTVSVDVLSPTELNHSMESATLPRPRLLTVPGAMPKCPFMATALWENAVFHLENSIKQGRHTRGLRIYENCFRGAQAVTCLSTYLNAVLPKTVSRGQVLILCQKLVTTGVMEDVKDKERTMFKEGRLYRFSKEHFWQQPTDAADSSPSPSPTLFGCHSPTLRSTPTETNKIENTIRTPLAESSVKYPSDSTIVVSSRTKHRLFHRQSSYESNSEFKRRNARAGQTLKKAKSLMLHDWHTRPDPPPHRGNVKLSRRNAMRRVSKPMRLAKVSDQLAGFTKGEGQQGVCRAMAPAQRSQSQSYTVKDGTCIANYGLQRKFTDRAYLQTEMDADVAEVKENGGKLRKRTTMKEMNHTVKSYCIDTSLQGRTNEPRLFNACVSPVSTVREDAHAAAPAPAGMNWVVYG